MSTAPNVNLQFDFSKEDQLNTLKKRLESEMWNKEYHYKKYMEYSSMVDFLSKEVQRQC